MFAFTILFGSEYRLIWLAESFTDFMIQYAGLVVKHLKLPIFIDNGFTDLVTCSPHDQTLPKSIPQ